MSVDWKWQSNGGLLLDGNGDIAFTASPIESVIDMVQTRLKAGIDSWKLYRMGADLDRLLGSTSDEEMETTIQRQVENSLTKDFLPSGTFQVKTLRTGSRISVFVFLSDSLVATANVVVPSN